MFHTDIWHVCGLSLCVCVRACRGNGCLLLEGKEPVLHGLQVQSGRNIFFLQRVYTSKLPGHECVQLLLSLPVWWRWYGFAEIGLCFSTGCLTLRETLWRPFVIHSAKPHPRVVTTNTSVNVSSPHTTTLRAYKYISKVVVKAKHREKGVSICSPFGPTTVSCQDLNLILYLNQTM